MLIVDDSGIIRTMVAKILRMTAISLGEIRYASNGQEALDILGNHQIDIVFADINMPVMDGEELIREMLSRNIFPAVPVIVISTEQSKKKMDSLRALGVRDYLTKPFHPEQLMEVLQKYLKNT